jgi:hypothetical protein
VCGNDGSTTSQLTVLVFVLDPELGTIDTPNGNVAFLQLFGVTDEERAEMKESSTESVGTGSRCSRLGWRVLRNAP